MQNINFSFPIIWDIIVLIVLVVFALLGRKRGLIKMISGLLVLVVSITVSGMLAKWTTPYISSSVVQPYVTQLLLPDAKEEASVSSDINSDASDITSTLSKFGLSSASISKAMENFKEEAASSLENAISSLSETVSIKITYGITFIVYLLLSLLIFSLLARLLNLAAKLPVISFFNSLGGLLLGVIWGYLIVFIISTIIVKFSILITPDVMERTVILKFILTKNPILLLPIWN